MIRKASFLLLILAGFLSAQPAGAFRVEFDYARFSYDDTSDYVEIYYSFSQGQFAPVKVEGVNTGQGVLDISIYDITKDSLILKREYGFKINFDDTANFDESKSLVGNIAYVLPVGNYRVTMLGYDSNLPERRDSVVAEMTVRPLPNDRFSVSDIQFASSIKKSEDETSLFYKNTYEVIPNPSGLFGEQLPVIYFYTEMYNLNKAVFSDVLKIEYLLLNSKNIPVYRRVKFIKRANSSIVEAGTINVHKTPTGTYTMVVSVSDTVKNLQAVISKKLFVYNKDVIDTVTENLSDFEFLASEFATMSDEEIAESYGISKYIASKAEIQQWEKLSEPEAKRNFLFTFWKSRDQVVETPDNEFKNEYWRRVKYANDHYATFQKKGWLTDRGRVYIMYGEPSEVERYPNQVDTKPHEIWTYNSLEGGVVFVFADLTSFSDYQLLHSTLRGELRDDNWRRKIQSL
ncbi:MAG: GWxTD domain-containing protein [Ignavibacteriaceae bacterium]|nr:GWxTD domain-containing protein [Ignavibacteriaceae bacterium]